MDFVLRFFALKLKAFLLQNLDLDPKQVGDMLSHVWHRRVLRGCNSMQLLFSTFLGIP